MADKKEDKPLGVVAVIRQDLATSKDGMTVEDLVASLADAFPDRDAEKMKGTVRTQLSGRLAAQGHTIHKERIKDRGMVYKITNLAA